MAYREFDKERAAIFSDSTNRTVLKLTLGDGDKLSASRKREILEQAPRITTLHIVQNWADTKSRSFSHGYRIKTYRVNVNGQWYLDTDTTKTC